MIRVVVVTDVRLYRDWIAHALRTHELVDAVATVADLNCISNTVATLRPTVVLLDVRMPRAKEWLERSDCRALNARVVGFAVDGNLASKIDWLQAGAVEVVEKESTLSDLVERINGAANEEVTLSPREVGGVVARLQDLAARSTCDPGLADLTRRESTILQILAEHGDRSNKQLARDLGVQESTIKNHMHHVLEKLGVASRMQAVALFSAHYRRPVQQSSLQDSIPSDSHF